MTRSQEKVLVATLCGLIVAVAAAFAVQPTIAAAQPVPVTFSAVSYR